MIWRVTLIFSMIGIELPVNAPGSTVAVDQFRFERSIEAATPDEADEKARKFVLDLFPGSVVSFVYSETHLQIRS